MIYDQFTSLCQFLGVNWRAEDCITFSEDLLTESDLEGFTRIVDLGEYYNLGFCIVAFGIIWKEI